jgi:hypothetical protein
MLCRLPKTNVHNARIPREDDAEFSNHGTRGIYHADVLDREEAVCVLSPNWPCMSSSPSPSISSSRDHSTLEVRRILRQCMSKTARRSHIHPPSPPNNPVQHNPPTPTYPTYRRSPSRDPALYKRALGGACAANPRDDLEEYIPARCTRFQTRNPRLFWWKSAEGLWG